jgi:hypothetical protein
MMLMQHFEYGNTCGVLLLISVSLLPVGSVIVVQVGGKMVLR